MRDIAECQAACQEKENCKAIVYGRDNEDTQCKLAIDYTKATAGVGFDKNHESIYCELVEAGKYDSTSILECCECFVYSS